MFYIHTNKIGLDEGKVSFLFDDGENLWSFREGHRFYQAYLAWAADGNIAEEWTGN